MSVAAGSEGPVADAGPQDEAEYLPPAADPYWDELTGEAMRRLAELRRGHRRAKLASIATLVYAAALIGGFYGLSYASYTLRAADAGHPYATLAPQVAAALPVGLMAAFTLTLVALGRDATWRGPVLLEGASAAWLLPLPIRRAALLRGKLRLAIALATALGALVGLALGFLAHVLGLGGLGADMVDGAAGSALIGCLGVAVAALVERRAGEPGTGRRWALAWLAPVLLGGQAAAAATGHASGAVEAVELWSGPWGWAAQPLVVAAGGSTPGLLPAPALGLLAVTAVAAAALADRQVGRIGGAALRRRAATMSSVLGALYAAEVRQAGLAVRAARGQGFVRRAKLPLPRTRALLVPWRDATSLLRAPGRLAWSALGMVGALGLLAVAGTAHGRGSVVVPLLCGLTLAYLAAAQLVEPARLDGDDHRRSAMLPYRYPRLAMWHAVVPVALLALFGGVGAAVLGLAGAPALPTVLLLAAVPALVGASLVSAYRGPTPPGLLVGAETPTGNTGPAQVVVWYLRGPLVVIAFGAVQTLLSLRALRTGDLAHVLATALPWSALAGLVLLGWARRCAAKLSQL